MHSVNFFFFFKPKKFKAIIMMNILMDNTDSLTKLLLLEL